MYNAKDRLPMVHILVFYTGERPWNAANKLSQLIKSKSSRHEWMWNGWIYKN